MPATILDLAIPVNGADPDYSTFIGIRFNSFARPGQIWVAPSVSNLSFIRCVFLGGGLSIGFSNQPNEANWFFFQCAFINPNTFGVAVQNLQGTGHVFMNCIFNSHVQAFSTFNATNVNFINCFFSMFQAHTFNFSSSPNANSSANFINSIIDGHFGFGNTPVTWKFENTMALGPGTNLAAAFLNLPTRSANGENFEGTAIFKNFPHSAAFNFNVHDLTLMPGSDGIGAGANGLDVGPYGGVSPFVPGGIPPLPFIEFAELLTPIVPADQNIQIQVKANVQN